LLWILISREKRLKQKEIRTYIQRDSGRTIWGGTETLYPSDPENSGAEFTAIASAVNVAWFIKKPNFQRLTVDGDN
jgi:hypothetical protein